MTAAFGASAPALLRADAIDVWRASVEAVDSARLVRNVVRRDASQLTVCGHTFALERIGRICVVGAGKAGAGMAAGLEQALGPDLLAEKVDGWINVPADCVTPLQRIRLHAARPAGLNEPTLAGVAGAERILEMVSQLGPRDLCLVLLSGGASALLPAPVPGIALADKQAVTRMLSRAGASINELNCVRKQLSRIKGGRLAQACRAGTLITLVISDIIGDPLELIGSGPTVPDSSTPRDALEILQRFDPRAELTPPAVFRWLSRDRPECPTPVVAQVSTHVIGNNDVALDAAADRARQRGYNVIDIVRGEAGVAREVGADLACRCLQLRAEGRRGRRCLLTGGEPIVHLEPSDRPQKGGRNQELALAAVTAAWEAGLQGVCILSGGTDGEDGPTDAAGAIADQHVIAAARRLALDPRAFLDDHNAYPFFEQTGGLLKTGPTHTNVMDVRVALIDDLR